MKSWLCILFLLICSETFSEENWQSHWHKGYNYYYNKQYHEASLEFDQAINLMSEKEQETYPYVLLSRIENDYSLQNFSRVIQDTDKVLDLKNLTEYERLSCGSKRISIFMKMNDQDTALKEYEKHIINCPFFPKYNFSERKIVIRSVPDCQCYKNSTKRFMMTTFGISENDIHDYGDMWIIDLPENCDQCDCENTKKEEKEISTAKTRSPEQIRGCCNTCSTLAVSANIICGCLSGAPDLFSVVCKVACFMFVEQLRQTCEWCCYNGGIQEKCWKNFETWKVDYKEENPTCPQPPKECP